MIASSNSQTASEIVVGGYYFASLVGFPVSVLRVKVARVDGDYVWVKTADLVSAGTPLTIDASRILEEAR